MKVVAAMCVTSLNDYIRMDSLCLGHQVLDSVILTELQFDNSDIGNVKRIKGIQTGDNKLCRIKELVKSGKPPLKADFWISFDNDVW